MFCIKCGKQLPDDAAFCFACGAAVYNGGNAASVTSEAPAVENGATFTVTTSGTLPVAKDAVADFGDFFIDGDVIYFVTHGYDGGQHTQLWKSDLGGNNKQCLLEFDKTGYTPGVFVQSDGFYYMAKVGCLILFQVHNENNDYLNYYYNVDNGTHGAITHVPRVPYKISADGKYFVDCNHDNREEGSVIVTVMTPYEALTDGRGREIYLNSRTLWTMYAQYENIRFNETDCFVYNGNQLLISFYDNADFLWARIDLFNLSDFAVLKPATYTLTGHGGIVSCGSNVIFGDYSSNVYACVDTKDMTVKSTVPMLSPNVSVYGNYVYIDSYSEVKALLVDLKTGGVKVYAKPNKTFDYGILKSIRQAKNGFYKYAYDGGQTSIYYIANADVLKPFDGEYEGDECVPPVISVTYTRNFVPTVRNAALDENVYTAQNTFELGAASLEYLQKTNLDVYYKFLEWNFYSQFVTLPDGKRVGFIYGHMDEYKGNKDYYYNLYELNFDGTYKSLGCGSRGGIEDLKIYKNYAYWNDICVCRYDFTNGEFIESNDEWLRKEYENVCSKVTSDQL